MTAFLRIASTALLIYAAVWLESKWAMALLWGSVAFANELIGAEIRALKRK